MQNYTYVETYVEYFVEINKLNLFFIVLPGH